MKLKISEWGNSHGIRIPNTIMEHLQIQAGDDVEIYLTEKGVEIEKSKHSLHYLKSVKKEVLEAILAQTNPIKRVDDPYSETETAYIVVDTDPCSPVIREVPKGTANSFTTLADAKEAARQCIQSSIIEAQKSLITLRQLGVDKISYISL